MIWFAHWIGTTRRQFSHRSHIAPTINYVRKHIKCAHTPHFWRTSDASNWFRKRDNVNVFRCIAESWCVCLSIRLSRSHSLRVCPSDTQNEIQFPFQFYILISMLQVDFCLNIKHSKRVKRYFILYSEIEEGADASLYDITRNSNL